MSYDFDSAADVIDYSADRVVRNRPDDHEAAHVAARCRRPADHVRDVEAGKTVERGSRPRRTVKAVWIVGRSDVETAMPRIRDMILEAEFDHADGSDLHAAMRSMGVSSHEFQDD